MLIKPDSSQDRKNLWEAKLISEQGAIHLHSKGNLHHIGPLISLGRSNFKMGDYSQAESYLTQALKLANVHNKNSYYAGALIRLAEVKLAKGETSKAKDLILKVKKTCQIVR